MTERELKKIRAEFPPGMKVEYIGADKSEFSKDRIIGVVDWVSSTGMIYVKWDGDTNAQPRTCWMEDLVRVDE